MTLSVCLSHCVAAQEDTPKNEQGVQKLQMLLKELRELKTQIQKEKNSWESEKRRLSLLLKQQKARLRGQEVKSDSLQKKVDELNSELEADQQKLEKRSRHLQQINEWTRSALKKMTGRLSQNPFLGNRTIRRKLSDLHARKLSVSDLGAVFWNQMLRIASFGAKPVVASKEILVAGTTKEVTVLRVGAVCSVFLTHDEQTCGIAEVSNGEVLWRVLPSDYVDSVKLAVDVASRDVPAEVVTIPFSRSTVVEVKETEGRKDREHE